MTNNILATEMRTTLPAYEPDHCSTNSSIKFSDWK